MRARRVHCGRARQRGRAADDVHLVPDRHRDRRTAFRRQRRESTPGVRGGVVLPGIVDRNPGGRTRLRQHEAAEGVDLSLVLGEGNVVRSERHRFLLRPLVARRIVFVHHADRLPSRREAAEDVHLAAGRSAEQLFSRFRERGKLRPFPLSESAARPEQAGERKRHGAYEIHGLLLA